MPEVRRLRSAELEIRNEEKQTEGLNSIKLKIDINIQLLQKPKGHRRHERGNIFHLGANTQMISAKLLLLIILPIFLVTLLNLRKLGRYLPDLAPKR